MVSKKIIEIALIVIAFILFLGILKAWGPWVLLGNILVALVALKVLGWLGIKIEISMWSILILLLGGIIGLLLVMFLSVSGIAFKAKK
ncbi:MAG: hypothetical protein ABII71_04815 [Candidatus Micrarchaeota archaeon]